MVPGLHRMLAELLGVGWPEILLDILGLSEQEVGKLHDDGIVAGADMTQ